MIQTTVDIFCLMGEIKNMGLTSEQLDNLINQMIDYKVEVDKEGHTNFMQDLLDNEISFNF